MEKIMEENNRNSETPEKKKWLRHCKHGTGKKIMLIALAITVVAIVACSLLAPRNSHAGFGGPGRFGYASHFGEDPASHVKIAVEHILGHADATDEQKKKAEAILSENAEMMKQRYNAFTSLKKETVKLLTATNIDRDALESLRKEKMKAMDETSSNLVRVVAEIAELLTPEQRAKIADHHEKRWGCKS